MMPLPDRGLSRVVLVGVSEFTDPALHSLPAAANNLDAVRRALVDQDSCGIRQENCVLVGDQHEPVDAQGVRAALRAAARYAEDLLLVYYVGHGLPLDPGDLVLATTDTKRDSPRDQGLPIADVHDVFLTSRARTRILILDCCYSGRALEHMGQDKATATLASVSATERGEAPEHAEFTEFGGHLVRILRRGIAGGEPTLSLRMIAKAIREQPDADRLARLQDSQGAADVPLVRNAAHRSPGHPATINLTQLAYVEQGVESVASKICRTIGPRGRSNLIPATDGKTKEADDPATVVEYYEPAGQPDEVRIGVGYIRDLVHVMYRQVGDGGATAVAIAQALVTGVFEAVRQDRHLNELVDGVERAFAWARGTVDKWARPVDSVEQLISVARSSARDQHVGSLVAESVNRAGASGAVLVENGHRHVSSLEFAPGLRVGGAGAVREWYTDPVRGDVTLDEPLVVVEDLLTVDHVHSAVARAERDGRPLAIFAASVDGDALAAAVSAKTPDGPGLLVVALPHPDAGEVAERIRNLLKPPRRGLGLPRKVLATGDQTLIVWTSSGDQRIEPLVDWLPVIRVSARQDADQHSLRRLTEAAVSSAFAAALDGGTVAGGGIALRDLARELTVRPHDVLPDHLPMTADMLVGIRIAADALTAPARHMADNARLAGPELQALLDAAPGVGKDLADKRTVDMVEHGIIDPVEVVRVAMEQALGTLRRFIRLA